MAHNAPFEVSLEDRVVNLVNGTGAVLEAVTLAPETLEAQRIGTDQIRDIDALVAKFNLTATPEEANGTSWELGFSAGALHAARGIMTAFVSTKPKERALSPTKDLSRVDEIGRYLAGLQFGSALRILVIPEPALAPSGGSNGYAKGVDYALDRSVGNFQTRLQNRVLRTQEKPDRTIPEQHVSALLFVALTEPSPHRVVDALGGNVRSILDDLDERGFVTRMTSAGSHYLQITEAGAQEAIQLVRETNAA